MTSQMTNEFMTVPGADLLHRALADEGDPELLKAWLALGVDVNDKRLTQPQGLGSFPYGSPILCISCSRSTENHREMAKLLIQAGANPSLNVTHAGFTPLMLTLIQSPCSLEIARMLLDAGEDVQASRPNGWSAVHAAASRGHLEVLEMLHSRGAKLDTFCKKDAAQGAEDTTTVLHMACNNREMTDWLVQRVPHLLNTMTENRHTPLAFAVDAGNIGVVQSLVSAGADTSLKFEYGGQEVDACEYAKKTRKTEIQQWIIAWESAHEAHQIVDQLRKRTAGAAP